MIANDNNEKTFIATYRCRCCGEKFDGVSTTNRKIVEDIVYAFSSGQHTVVLPVQSGGSFPITMLEIHECKSEKLPVGITKGTVGLGEFIGFEVRLDNNK